jgi:Uma2 family endonuclease
MSEPIKKFAFDNKRKTEMIDGKIYFMARPCDEHMDVQYNITKIFNDYFKQNKRRCRAYFESQLYVNDKNYYVPDVKIICREKRSDDIPVIIIEVLSKSNPEYDTVLKMKKYAELGIKEYWIITWGLAKIEIYLLNEDKVYEKNITYTYFTEKELRRLDEEELKEVVTEFSSVSFPELIIRLEDVFDIFE